MVKQVFVLLFGLLLIGASAFGTNVGASNELNNASFLRIHIRANSNLESDQNVKYLVKDEIVKFLTPKLSNATTKERALEIVAQNCDAISNVATTVLEKNGYTYKASTKLTKEEFPT